MGTIFRVDEHWIELQEKAEQNFLKEYKENKYDFEQPYVVQNPYLINPLSAIILLSTEEPMTIDVIVKGKTVDADFCFKGVVGTEHVLPVLGLYAGTENKVILQAENGIQKELYIKTEEAPNNIMRAQITKKNIDLSEQLFFAVPVCDDFLTAGYDRNGDCRWYSSIPLAYNFEKAQNGHIFAGGPYVLTPPFSPTTLFEMDLLGKIYKEYRLPNGYREGLFEKKDGNLLLLGQKSAFGTVGDLIYLMDRKNGSVINIWDMKDILPQDVAGSGRQLGTNWFHASSVWYDEVTKSITVSGRHQDIIVNFDAETKKINWMLGDPENWPVEYIEQYFLKPVGELEWPYEPQSVKFLNENRFICFDSGEFRSKNKECYVKAADNYSRAVVYKVDSFNKTVEQEWQYGKEVGSDFFSPYMGNITVYGEDHYGIQAGGCAKIDGQASDLLGIFQKKVDANTELYSITKEIRNKQVISEIVLAGNYYAVQRLSLAEVKKHFGFGKGQYIGDWAENEEFSVDMPAIDGGMIPNEYQLELHTDGERLIMRGIFQKGDIIMIYLENESEKHQHFVQCTRIPLGTECLFTYGGGKGRPAVWPIYIGSLYGNYNVKILVNEKLYRTGIILDLGKKRESECMM